MVGDERVLAQQRVRDLLGAGEQAALGGAGGGEDLQPVAAGGAGEEADGAGVGGAISAGEEHGGGRSQSRTRQPRRMVVVRVGAGAKW